MECPLCIEKFNKSAHKQLVCPNCQYSVCHACIKYYLLGSTLQPVCMNCKIEWKPDFIRENISQNFLNNEYKKFKENMLLSLEESLLPDTQSYAVFQKDIARENLELGKLKQLIKDLKNDYRDKLYAYHNKLRIGYRKDDKKRDFVMSCPDNNCNGFLSMHYKCQQCEKQYCKNCHELRTEDHECKQEDIETVKLLSVNTKKCPKCFIPIFKIMGCNQMFCTECHTPFDWNTGKIINGVIHNPHFFEWQRDQTNPRNITNNECGGIPHISRFRFLEYKKQTEIGHVLQFVTHVRHVILPQYHYHDNSIEQNRDLRVSYLNNNISKDHFKWLIQKRHKANDRKRAYNQLCAMFVTTSIDLLNNLIVDKNINEFYNQFHRLRSYVNTQLERISKLYSSKKRYISKHLEFI